MPGLDDDETEHLLWELVEAYVERREHTAETNRRDALRDRLDNALGRKSSRKRGRRRRR